MTEFPAFMKSARNRVDAGQQNTAGIEGYYFVGNDGCQMAIWTMHSDQVSKKHKHEFDEYMVVVSGLYTVHLNGQSLVLHPGDELLIPKGTEQWGEGIAGTRTIHAFGGKRIK